MNENQTAERVDAGNVVIQVKNLHKIYKVGSTKVRALNGVDFEVCEGEFCAIVGTSGVRMWDSFFSHLTCWER